MLVAGYITGQPDGRAERQFAEEQCAISTNSPLPVVVLLDDVDDHVHRHIDNVVALLRRCRLTSRCRQTPDV